MLFDKSKPIILDSDGVVTDYNSVVPSVWRRVTGNNLAEVDPNAYYSKNRFGLSSDVNDVRATLFEHFQYNDWANMGLLPGAKEACEILIAKGYTLICVTAMPHEYGPARLENFQKNQLPIFKVITAPAEDGVLNSKLRPVLALDGCAFVDDLLKNFHGLEDLHTVWLHAREFSDCPNAQLRHLNLHKEKAASLLEFANRMP